MSQTGLETYFRTREQPTRLPCRGAILKVDPQYTSQKCPGCGAIDKTARDRSQHRYTCKHCGRVYNDDEVAAKNLRQLGIWCVSGVDNPHFSKKVSGY